MFPVGVPKTNFLSSRNGRRLVPIFRLIWVLALLQGEFLVFWFAARRCSPWPTHSPHQAMAQQPVDRMMLIGDPQITDAFSYPREGVLLRLSEFYSDRYMRRNYHLLLNQLQPQAVMMMGDLMDGGREWKDEGWQKEVDRFFRLFNSQAPTYYMVGNHDIGFGNGIRPDVKRRFISAFGPTSYFVNMTNYVLVVIDTVSLSSSDPNVYQDALDVMTSSLPPLPRILMTHVPLYRPEGTYCGPDRWQSRPGGIRDGQGYQYQNLLSPELSKQLLDHINPKAIFSGDDHDYCAVTHRPGVTEYTVPTFSMAQGLRYPGVMLLDLSSSEPGIKVCWFPDQVNIFIAYGCLLGFTLITLLSTQLYRNRLLSTASQRKMYSQDTEELSISQALFNRPKVSRIEALKRIMNGFLKDVFDIAVVGLGFYLLLLLIL